MTSEMVTGVVASRSMTPRQRKKLKEGEDHQIHFLLPAATIRLIDDVAQASGGLQRTAAIKMLLAEALRARGMLK